MKRDLDLLRHILLAIESTSTPTIESNYSIESENYDSLTISYHIHLLIEADYLSAYDARSKTGPYDYLEIELTNKGYEFLDSFKDSAFWKSAVKYMKENALPLTLDTAISILPKILQ